MVQRGIVVLMLFIFIIELVDLSHFKTVKFENVRLRFLDLDPVNVPARVLCPLRKRIKHVAGKQNLRLVTFAKFVNSNRNCRIRRHVEKIDFHVAANGALDGDADVETE